MGLRRTLTPILLAATAVVLAAGSRRYGIRTTAVDLGPFSAAGPATYAIWLESEGRRRRVLVYLPHAATPAGGLPLVLALHGAGGAGDRLEDLIRLQPIAAREGFVIAYPDGLGAVWNAGLSADPGPVDDVAFLLQVIDRLAGLLSIDRRRVYAAGFSNGAMMAHRLACDAADRIAAVALVAGTPEVETLRRSGPPARPVPLIAFHGDADRIIPYRGGRISGLIPGWSRGRAASVEDLKRFWLRHNRCGAEATVTTYASPGGDGTRVVAEAFAGGGDVVFYRIEGGGHTWPGGKQLLPRQVIGNTSRAINASELIWRFFAAHPLPDAGPSPGGRPAD